MPHTHASTALSEQPAAVLGVQQSLPTPPRSQRNAHKLIASATHSASYRSLQHASSCAHKQPSVTGSVQPGPSPTEQQSFCADEEPARAPDAEAGAGDGRVDREAPDPPSSASPPAEPAEARSDGAASPTGELPLHARNTATNGTTKRCPRATPMILVSPMHSFPRSPASRSAPRRAPREDPGAGSRGLLPWQYAVSFTARPRAAPRRGQAEPLQPSLSRAG